MTITEMVTCNKMGRDVKVERNEMELDNGNGPDLIVITRICKESKCDKRGCQLKTSERRWK